MSYVYPTVHQDFLNKVNRDFNLNLAEQNQTKFFSGLSGMVLTNWLHRRKLRNGLNLWNIWLADLQHFCGLEHFYVSAHLSLRIAARKIHLRTTSIWVSSKFRFLIRISIKVKGGSLIRVSDFFFGRNFGFDSKIFSNFFYKKRWQCRFQ